MNEDNDDLVKGHNEISIENNIIDDFMQPCAYAYTLNHFQKSIQIFPPFNFEGSKLTLNSFDANTENDKERITRPFIQHFARLNTPVSSIRSFPFGNKFAIGTINSIYIISNKLEPTISFPKDESTLIKNIDVHPSSMLLACDGPTGHNSIRVVNLQDQQTIMELNYHKKAVSSILFQPSFCKILTTSYDGSIIISDLIKKKECYKFDQYEDKNAITTSSMKNDESTISVGFDNGLIGIFDEKESSGMIQIKGKHSMWINSICFAPIKSYLAANSIDKSLSVWDLRYLSQPVFRKSEIDTAISKTLFLNDAVLAASTTNGELIQWDFNAGTIVRIDKVRDFGLFEMDIQREFDRIVLASEDTVVSMFNYHLSYLC